MMNLAAMMNTDQLPVLPLLLGKVSDCLRRVLEQEGVPAIDQGHPSEPAASRFVLFDSTLGGPGALVAGQTAIDLGSLHRGENEDPIAELSSTAWARRGWQVGPWLAEEEVARNDKRSVRHRLVEQLRGLVESAGGIWMRVAAVPCPYRTAFNFRLDHDDCIVADLQCVLRAAAGHEQALSHFISGAPFEGRDEVLAALRGMDIGSHGYWHHTYRDAEENRRNIARGVDVLRAAGIEPSGFVAPHGRWPRGLERVLDELKISHSSEFSLAYDDWPFFPARSSVLQIPIHPVCLGICLEAADRAGGGAAGRQQAADALASYFEHLAAQKHAAGEPLFFYGHPDGRLGRYPDVLRRLLLAVSQLPGVWETNLTDFGNWWRARGNARFSVYGQNGLFRVSAARLPTEHRLTLEIFHGNAVARVPVESEDFSFSSAELDFQPAPPPPVAATIDCKPHASLRSGLLRYLDWEKQTPLDEIPSHHLRGWVKHKLRQWRGAQPSRRTGSNA